VAARKKPPAYGSKRIKSLVCNACLDGKCYDCTDVERVILGLSEQCPCTRVGHQGEPGDGHEPSAYESDLAFGHIVSKMGMSGE
jgi:hypothetical protein